MTDTTRLGLPYPVDADPADVPTWMRNLALDLDALVPSDAQGAIGSRPAAGTAGRYYTTTNEGVAPITYRDDGAAWRRIGYVPLVTTLPTNPADGDVVLWNYADGTPEGAFWNMRWNQTAGRWEYMGGTPSVYGGTAGYTITTAGTAQYLGLTTPPLPHGGTWFARWRAHPRNGAALVPNTTQIAYVGASKNGNMAGTSMSYIEWAIGPSVAAYVVTNATIGGQQPILGLAKNEVIDLRGQIYINGGVDFVARMLEVHPVRLTP